MAEERAIAFEALNQALQTVARSRLFKDYNEAEMHAIFNVLRSGNRRGQTQGALLSELSELLSAHHPLLKLFVHSAYVKSTRQDLGEDTDSEDTDSDCEGDTTGNTTTHGEGTAAGNTWGPPNPMAGMPSGRIADYLVTTLKEVPHTRQLFLNFATALGPEGMWQVLQEVNEAIAADAASTRVASGERSRTAGGLFIKLAKIKVAAAKKAKEAAQVRPDFTLRPYQQQAVDSITRQGGNWVVAAPTNTGKTAMFIEVSKRLLASKPQGTVVVLVPTVSLTRQQCNAYESAGFRPAQGGGDQPANAPVVDWFCSDKPLPPTTWSREVQRLNVIVIEAQSFANLVESGAAALADIDILVFDECHHAAKKHPYARIMAKYHTCEGERPQVMGFSASPAKGKDLDEVLTDLYKRLDFMQARLIAVSEDDTAVREIAPGPNEEHRVIRDWREEDDDWSKFLQHTAHAFATHIPTQQAAYKTVVAPPPSAADVSHHPVQAYNLMCKWLNEVAQLANAWQLRNLSHCVHVLEVIRHAEALSQDIGFECGLVYLANRLLAEALTTPNPTRTPHNPQRTWLPPPRPAPAAAPADVTAALSSLSLHVTNGPAAADIHAAAQRQKRTARLTAVMPCKDIDLTGRALCCVLLALFCQWNPHYESTDPLCAMSSVVTETGSQEGVRGASECGDGCRILAGRAVASLVGEAVEAPPMTHHKVWVLIQYLREYRTKADFHGIIFCRSRQVAYHLAKLLSSARESTKDGQPGPLYFVTDVSLFVGHGGANTIKSRLGSTVGVAAGSGAARGMNITQQMAVLQQFKAPGRKLLIATNAAEEGLDLPCCEFVVRFSPPATGIQRVQGRGRARKLGAKYLELLQAPSPASLAHGGHDWALHRNAVAEEQSLRSVLRREAAKEQNIPPAQVTAVGSCAGA